MNGIEYVERPPLDNATLDILYTRAWPRHRPYDFAPVLDRSLTYVGAFMDGKLIGFVYVATDGDAHAFLLEPTVDPAYRRRGIGLELVRRAALSAKGAGAEWLHVDFEPQLEPFYRRAGFRPTPAGLIRLRP